MTCAVEKGVGELADVAGCETFATEKSEVGFDWNLEVEVFGRVKVVVTRVDCVGEKVMVVIGLVISQNCTGC
jgi:hypothetical protein